MSAKGTIRAINQLTQDLENRVEFDGVTFTTGTRYERLREIDARRAPPLVKADGRICM